MLNPNYIELVKAQLAQFASQADFETVLTTAFGTKIDSPQERLRQRSKIFQLRQQWLKGDFSIIPPIDILTHGELNNANGGYAASEDKIFVSSDFLARNQQNSKTITGLLLEEIGHKIDRFFNGDLDSAGDEGDIFSRLVSGQTLSAQTLARLKAEDDTAVIIVDGRVVSIEQDTFGGDANDNTIDGTSGVDLILGKGGDDTLRGYAGNDWIYGDEGNDSLDGGTGNDHLYGGTGDDYIYSGTGADTIEGEIGPGDLIVSIPGNDYLYIANYNDTANTTIKYAAVSDGKITGGSNNGTTFKNIDSVSFATGSGNDSINISAAVTGGVYNYNYVSAGAGNDSIFGGLNAANYLYGGDGNDWIYGNGNGANFLNGGANEDIIYGGSGNDSIYGGAGNDYINSGEGVDFIDGQEGDDRLGIYNIYDTANTTITYTTATNGKITNGSNNGTTFQNIESVDLITGSGKDDIDVSAATGGNVVNAGGGNDYIMTSKGNDTIYGGTGDDFIESGTGADSLDGEAGNDYFYIDNESDTANTTITYLTASSGKIFGGRNNGTTFKNIESAGILTGSGNDKIDIVGTTSANYIESGAGNDTINGGSGNDTINAGKGADILNGGGGKDLLDIGNYYYPNLDTANTKILYTTVLNGTIAGGSSNGTTFKNVETIRSQTGSGSDYIDVSAATGNNSISAGAGNDTLIGGAGNDHFYGGTGNDTMRGGTGNDTYSVDSASDIVTENANGGNDIIYSSAVNYTLVLNVEQLTLLGSANGTGNSGDNFISGDVLFLIPRKSYSNVINGGAGNDTLNGGTGNDTLNGGTGNDTLNGGTGNDIFLFNGGTAITGAVTVSSLLGKDKITDFTKGQDKIYLSKSTFTAITAVGAIGANFATVTAANDTLGGSLSGASLAGASSAAIVYNKTTGSIFYNQNGKVPGLGDNGGIFATLTTKPLLTASDFSIIA